MKNLLPVVFIILMPFGSISAQLSAHIIDSTNLSCFEAMDGSATVMVEGGSKPYVILWNDDSLTTDAIVTDLIANRWYRVTVTDDLDSLVMDSVMLSQPEEIQFELEGLEIIQCYGPAEGYIKITSMGGMGPHMYQWSGAIDSESDSIYNLEADKYYLEITDSIGCSVVDSLTLEEADMVEITIDSVFPNPCLGLEKGEIYTTGTGGEIPYEYSWTGPSDFTSQNQDLTGLKEGMYCLDLTDGRGCIYEKDTSIVDRDPITVTHSVSGFRDYNLVCFGDSSGSIRIDTVAGNGLDWENFTYIWKGPGGYVAYEHDIQNLVAGNYHLNVFDSVDCRSDVTITLIQPPPIVIFYDSVVANPCIDDLNSAIYITALNGIEPFSYNWTGPDGFASDSKNIMNLSKGQYAVTVTDEDGCKSFSDTTLLQVDDIDMILAVSEYGDYNVSCPGSDDGFIKIQSVPGYGDISEFTFYTTGPDGFTSPFRFMTTGVKAGAYHITITDPQGCSGEKDTTLTEPPAIQTGSISGDTLFLHDSNYVYSVENESLSSIYNWTVEGGEIWSGQGTHSVEIEWRTTGSGKVKVIETNEDGCVGDTVYMQTNFNDLSSVNPLAVSVMIYPNPVASTLFIKGVSHIRGTVEFYSLLGRMVLRTDLGEELNLDPLDKGVYYMSIRDRDGQMIQTRKIIKK